MGKIDNYLEKLQKKPTSAAGGPIEEKETVDLAALAALVHTPFPEKAFDEIVYKSLLPLMLLATKEEQGNEDLELAKTNAAKLTILFGDKEEALAYLQRYEKKNPDRKQLIHDACLFLLPAGEDWNINLWRGLAIKHMPKEALEKILPFAEKVEIYVNANRKELEGKAREKAANAVVKIKNAKNTLENRINLQIKNILSPNTSLTTLTNYMQNIGYKRAAENPEAAALFFRVGLRSNEFDQYLELKPVDDPQHIPDVGVIRLEDSPKFYLKKLDPHDPRAAILGKLTSCCQYLGGAGDSSAIHGITDPRGGFYVLCQQRSKDGPSKEDSIVAQCWAWRGKRNNLVFDSIESQCNFRQKHPEVIDGYFNKLADKLVREHDVKRVLIGSGGETPETLKVDRPLFPEQFIDYKGYSDARVQTILADELFKIASEPNQDPKMHLGLIKEWCAIVVLNEDSKEVLLPILTRLAPPEFPMAQFIEINENYKKLLNKTKTIKESVVDADWDEARWLALEDLIKQGADVNIPFGNMRDQFLLNQAIQAGRLSTVKLLLENKAVEVVNVVDSYGNTPLHGVRNAVIARLLIKHMDDLNAVNSSGETALITVLRSSLDSDSEAEMRTLDLAKALVENHAKVNVIDSGGNTPLYCAVSARLFKVTQYLLQNGADANLTQRVDKRMPLHQAVEEINLELVKLLVECGADVNAQDAYKNTALHQLARRRDRTSESCAQYMLQNNAEPNARDEKGRTPLLEAAERGHLGMVKILIEQGADVSSADDNQNTALHLAAGRGHLTVVQYLVNCGADVNAENSDSRTPLDCIAITNPSFDKIADILLRKGALDLKKSFKKEPLLQEAVLYRDLEVVKHFIEDWGAVVDVRNPSEKTPLIVAVGIPNVPIAKYLLKRGANVNAADQHGSTALSLASAKGDLDFIQDLVILGANVNAQNNDQNTALHLAAENGHLTVVQYLIGKGKAKIDFKNKDGKSAAEVATPEIADYFAAYFSGLEIKQHQQTAATLSKVGTFPSTDSRPDEDSVTSVKKTKPTGPAATS
jgi:ankyrin repeat protein